MACHTVPTSGPSQSEVLSQDTENEKENEVAVPEVNVIEVNSGVVDSLYRKQQEQSFKNFPQKGSDYTGSVSVGDTLEVMIWEAPPAILFGSVLNENGTGGAQLTKLPEQMVNKSGKITIPFLGGITVRDKTPERIQNELVKRLAPMANEPQVLVRLIKNNAKNVTVLRQGSSIRMPLTANKERVLDAVAAVGGATTGIQDVSVQLARGTTVRTLSLETLAATPTENITLRSGDVVTLLNNPLSFTGLGAVGKNQQMKFAAKGISLAEAIGNMGGLIDDRSDPKGIFVFRQTPFIELTPQEQELWTARGYDADMDIPTVFRVDLLHPKSIFWLQRFPIQDKDVVYVSNAPMAEFQKFLRLIFSITSPITSTVNTVNDL